jgi:hypothetical protein
VAELRNDGLPSQFRVQRTDANLGLQATAGRLWDNWPSAVQWRVKWKEHSLDT